MTRKTTPPVQAARARRLQELADQGPKPARTPHEFVQEKMREDRRARTRAPGGRKK